jgi:hypothetical protein
MSARAIIASCQRKFPDFANDCSGFVKAVAHDCGVILVGNANDIVDELKTSWTISSAWNLIPDGVAAKEYAKNGYLVIAGAQAAGHGHVVVVVDGPLAQAKYPYAFWGRYRGLTTPLGETINVGFSRGHGTLNYSFGANALSDLTYAGIKPSALLLPRPSGSEGILIYR